MNTVEDATGAGAESPEEVLALFRDEAALYAKLESYAITQRSLVTRDDFGPLLSLLVDRQRLSVALTSIGTRLAPVRRDWEAYCERLSPAQRSLAERFTRDIAERLRRVIQSDERDARLLSVRKQAVGQALRTTHSVGQALSAYRGPVGGGRGTGHLDEAS